MRVTACDFISHYSALSTLLQDPTNILENVELLGRGHIDDNDNHEKLKRLYFQHKYGNRDDVSALFYGYFNKLLCDTTSIKSIYSSNHTLEHIWMVYSLRSELLSGLLELNKTRTKSKLYATRY
jgi:hypothetical protein